MTKTEKKLIRNMFLNNKKQQKADHLYWKKKDKNVNKRQLKILLL